MFDDSWMSFMGLRVQIASRYTRFACLPNKMPIQKPIMRGLIPEDSNHEGNDVL